MHDEFIRLTVDIIGSVAFGMQFNTINNGSDFMTDLEDVVVGFGERMLTPQLLWPLLKGSAKYMAACKRLRSLPQNLIDNRVKNGMNEVCVYFSVTQP